MQNDFSQVIGRIRESLSLSIDDFCVLTRMKKSEMLSIDKREEVSADLVAKISRKLNLDFENLYFGKIDYDALKNHLFELDLSYIPIRYRNSDGSKMLTVKNITDFLEKSFSKDVRTSVLKFLQISEESLSNTSRPISVKAFSDMNEYLSKYYFDRDTFFQAGSFLKQTTRGSLLEKELSKSKSPKELILKYIEDFSTLIEKNNIYKVKKINRYSCIVESTQSEAISDIYKKDEAEGRYGAYYRAGVMASSFEYINLPVGDVNLTKLAKNKKIHYRFEIEFPRLCSST